MGASIKPLCGYKAVKYLGLLHKPITVSSTYHIGNRFLTCTDKHNAVT